VLVNKKEAPKTFEDEEEILEIIPLPQTPPPLPPRISGCNREGEILESIPPRPFDPFLDSDMKEDVKEPSQYPRSE
jgi:hypothetical protein